MLEGGLVDVQTTRGRGGKRTVIPPPAKDKGASNGAHEGRLNEVRVKRLTAKGKKE